MLQQPSRRVLIAGGGIIGLTTGLALQRRGHDVLVCERAPLIRGAGAGLGLWPGAMRVFEELGVAGVIRAAGSPALIRYHDPTGAVLAPEAFDQLADGGFVMVQRAALNRQLADALGTEHIRVDAEVAGYTEEQDGVAVHFGDGRTERADVLVGADGAFSRVRAQLLPGSAARTQPGHAVWRAMISGREFAALPETIVIGRDRSRGGVMPAGDGVVFWVVAQFGVDGVGPSRKAEALARVKLLHEGDWEFPLQEMIESTPEEAILHEPISVVPALPRWASRRVVLAGDAAHAMSPHITSGASLGVEDAALLASCLADGGEIAPALARYEEDRIARYRQAVGYADALAETADPGDYAALFADFVRWLLAPQRA